MINKYYHKGIEFIKKNRRCCIFLPACMDKNLIIADTIAEAGAGANSVVVTDRPEAWEFSDLLIASPERIVPAEVVVLDGLPDYPLYRKIKNFNPDRLIISSDSQNLNDRTGLSLALDLVGSDIDVMTLTNGLKINSLDQLLNDDHIFMMSAEDYKQIDVDGYYPGCRIEDYHINGDIVQKLEALYHLVGKVANYVIYCKNAAEIETVKAYLGVRGFKDAPAALSKVDGSGRLFNIIWFSQPDNYSEYWNANLAGDAKHRIIYNLLFDDEPYYIKRPDFFLNYFMNQLEAQDVHS